jgi:hypothetical protein
MPIRRMNPGSRPPIPLIRRAPAPPPGTLLLSPDSPAVTPLRIDGLDAVPWHELAHAYGPADDLPGLITGLVHGRTEWDWAIGELLNKLLHQGDCYSATGPALIVLSRVAAAGSLPAARRRDVYLGLLGAADSYREDIIRDIDLAVAYSREPRPRRWAEQVRDAVGTVTPSLLARWADEPSACRLLLAALAGTFPRHGKAVAERIAAMADEFAGTQVWAYARLAHQLAIGDVSGALASAEAIATWNHEIDAERTDDELVDPRTRSLDILSQAVIEVTGRVGRT